MRCTTLCDKVCQWLATGWWFFPGPPVSSTNKTDRHDITEILLKVALNTIKQNKTKSSTKRSNFNLVYSLQAKEQSSYHARFQIQWDSKMLIIFFLSRETTPLIWPLFFHWRRGDLLRGVSLLEGDYYTE